MREIDFFTRLLGIQAIVIKLYFNEELCYNFFLPKQIVIAPVAQGIEYLTTNQRAVGSIPTGRTIQKHNARI